MTSVDIGLIVAASVQAIATIVLVGVTISYAISTKKQAAANVKMAEEMKEQRILASRPYMLIGTARKKDPEGGSPSFSHFEIFNTGSGPAIEVELAITGTNGKLNFHQTRKTFLQSQDEPMEFHPADLALLKARSVDNLSYTTYYCVCEYRGVLSNIGEKTWYQTWLPFEILIPFKEGRKAGEMTVTAGELQFKEVTEKDRINAFRGCKPPFDDVKPNGETITTPIKDNSGTTE